MGDYGSVYKKGGNKLKEQTFLVAIASLYWSYRIILVKFYFTVKNISMQMYLNTN